MKKSKLISIRVEHRTGTGTIIEMKLVPSDKAERMFSRVQRRTYRVGKVRDNN
jgi:hypothetical protein